MPLRDRPSHHRFRENRVRPSWDGVQEQWGSTKGEIIDRRPRSSMSSATGNPSPAIPAVLAIFALTYLGIAAGRVPGLKLDRTGIALLGAIAIMVFSELPTGVAVSFIN